MVDLTGYGVGLYLHAQAVDTTTPGGKALLQMAGVFADFEREMIRERVLAGQARARASGVRFGRPTIPADKAAAIVADLKGRRWCRQAREASRRRRWDRPEAQGEAGRLGDRLVGVCTLIEQNRVGSSPFAVQLVFSASRTSDLCKQFVPIRSESQSSI